MIVQIRRKGTKVCLSIFFKRDFTLSLLFNATKSRSYWVEIILNASESRMKAISNPFLIFQQLGIGYIRNSWRNLFDKWCFPQLFFRGAKQGKRMRNSSVPSGREREREILRPPFYIIKGLVIKRHFIFSLNRLIQEEERDSSYPVAFWKWKILGQYVRNSKVSTCIKISFECW